MFKRKTAKSTKATKALCKFKQICLRCGYTAYMFIVDTTRYIDCPCCGRYQVND